MPACKRNPDMDECPFTVTSSYQSEYEPALTYQSRLCKSCGIEYSATVESESAKVISIWPTLPVNKTGDTQ